MTVPVDPLFVLLPILEKEASSNFVRFSDILPDDVGLLEPMVESRIASMCDFQGISITLKLTMQTWHRVCAYIDLVQSKP